MKMIFGEVQVKCTAQESQVFWQLGVPGLFKSHTEN